MLKDFKHISTNFQTLYNQLLNISNTFTEYLSILINLRRFQGIAPFGSDVKTLKIFENTSKIPKKIVILSIF